MYSAWGNVSLVNATFAGNYADRSGDGLRISDGHVTIKNSVFWGNEGGGGYPEEEDVPISIGAGTVGISNSLVQGCGGSGAAWNPAFGTDAGNNIDANPMFVDFDGGDLQLTVGSPAVNTGNTLALPIDLLTDLAGNPRVIGSAVDMGAYELQVPNCQTFEVVTGVSWDGVSLQEVLDAEYGTGAIIAATDYEGYRCGDAVYPYWIDSNLDGWVVREIAGYSNLNELGWYVEGFSQPTIDGVDDGLIFDGSAGEGATVAVEFPHGTTRFGFYMNPRGPGDSTNAPEPEIFFTNRTYNDAGPDGSGDTRPPEGGDPQCLIYNITELRHGTPTYVLAWEDLDYGSPIAAEYRYDATDNDFQDLVVEIQAMSPVPVVMASLTAEQVRQGVRLRWEITGAEHLDRLELFRRHEQGIELSVASWTGKDIDALGEWLDTQSIQGGRLRYRLEGVSGAARISSEEVELNATPAVPTRTRLLAAIPNPFNPSTEIRFDLEARARVELAIFDLAGRKVNTLLRETRPAGEHAVTWDGRDDRGRRVASGTYLYQLRTGNYVETKRMVLLK
jgi:hypothetical protein